MDNAYAVSVGLTAAVAFALLNLAWLVSTNRDYQQGRSDGRSMDQQLLDKSNGATMDARVAYLVAQLGPNHSSWYARGYEIGLNELRVQLILRSHLRGLSEHD